MLNFKLVPIVVAGALLSMSSLSMADNGSRVPTLTNLNNSVGIELMSRDLEYHEDGYGLFTDSKYMDSENGSPVGIKFHASSIFENNVYASFTLGHVSGNTRYTGHFDPGTGPVPLTSTTQNTFTDISLRAGWVFNPSPEVNLIPYAEFTQDRWNRTLPAPPVPTGMGYTEKYSKNMLGIGLLSQWSPVKDVLLSLDLGVGHTYNNQMKTLGDTFKMTGSTERHIGVAGAWNFTDNWMVEGGYDRKYFEYGESPVVNGFFEPNSESTIQEVSFGFGYTFK